MNTSWGSARVCVRVCMCVWIWNDSVVEKLEKQWLILVIVSTNITMNNVTDSTTGIGTVVLINIITAIKKSKSAKWKYNMVNKEHAV